MKRVILVAMAAVLSGCTGTAVVLQEDAESFAEVVDAAVDATRAYYDQQGQQRFDYLIEFLAARPSCNVESPLLILTTEGRCLTDEEKLRRRDCRDDATAHSDCAVLLRVQSVAASPQITQPRQTTISLLRAVASYQRALSRVLKDETYDTAADLRDLESRLDELKNKIDELAGDDTSTEDSDEQLGKQINAVGTIVDLVRTAIEDNADFKALRVLVLDRGPAIDAALEELLSTYERVDQPYSELLARREIERNRRAYNDTPVHERGQLSFDERETLIRAIYEPELARLNAAAKPDTIAAGLRGLIRSHRKLQQGFKGDLTPAQRARIAQENQKQVEAAFRSMLSIVKLFT